jgi:hypothetical protein
VKKHDETKKALNKAIHLANLLLDEISQENLGKGKNHQQNIINTQFKEMLSPHCQKVNESIICASDIC